MMLNGILLLAMSLHAGNDSPISLDWDRYYDFPEFAYAEVNDITAHGNETILCGGRWNRYRDQADAEMVLIKHDQDGILQWMRFYQMDHGTVAYGSCLSDHGTLLVTGATRLGSTEEALFLIEANLANGSILSQYIVDPAADTRFDMGYDLIQHSNGNYYVLASLSSYNFTCLVRFDSHSFDWTNWWIENEHTGCAWAYADCLCEIPAGYTESGMIAVSYTTKNNGINEGARLAVLNPDLDLVAIKTLKFSCSDHLPYQPGTG